VLICAHPPMECGRAVRRQSVQRPAGYVVFQFDLTCSPSRLSCCAPRRPHAERPYRAWLPFHYLLYIVRTGAIMFVLMLYKTQTACWLVIVWWEFPCIALVTSLVESRQRGKLNFARAIARRRVCFSHGHQANEFDARRPFRPEKLVFVKKTESMLLSEAGAHRRAQLKRTLGGGQSPPWSRRVIGRREFTTFRTGRQYAAPRMLPHISGPGVPSGTSYAEFAAMSPWPGSATLRVRHARASFFA